MRFHGLVLSCSMKFRVSLTSGGISECIHQDDATFVQVIVRKTFIFDPCARFTVISLCAIFYGTFHSIDYTFPLSILLCFVVVGHMAIILISFGVILLACAITRLSQFPWIILEGYGYIDCKNSLTHWGRMTHICVSKLTIIGSDNALSPNRRRAIILTNAGILSVGKTSVILKKIKHFHSRKCIEIVVRTLAANLSWPQCVKCSNADSLRTVTHTCVSKIIIIGSDNGLSPDRRQAIIWTSTEILLIGPLETKCSEILIEIHTFSFQEINLKMSSGK